MDQFLFELAEMKYRMWHELFKFKPQAYTSDECIDRVKYLSRYEQLLNIINLLPNQQSKQLSEIERQYFSDAPYVVKIGQ